MLRLRVLTAALGIPLFLVALYAGGPYWAAALLLIATAGAHESAALMGLQGRRSGLAIALSWALVLGAYIVARDGAPATRLLAAAGVLALAGFSWFVLGAGVRPSGPWRLVGAGLYPGIFLAQLAMLREAGLAPTLFAVLVTWATDTFAYFVGSWRGRRPLWPSVSPNKTVEGAVGGLVGGVASGVALALALGEAPLWWAGAALIAALAAQVGDLVESRLKRQAGVKDSGRLLPGHGGALDRFDSLFFSATAVYSLLWLMR